MYTWFEENDKLHKPMYLVIYKVHLWAIEYISS